MKTNYYKTGLMTWIIALTLMIAQSCSKTEEANNKQEDKNPPAFAGRIIAPPDTLSQSNNPGAQEANTNITMANSFVSMAETFMTPPGKSTKGDGPPWVYTWEVDDNSGNYTMTLTIDENDQKSQWNMIVSGVMDEVTLNNFILIDGWQTKDEKSGSFTINDYKTQTITFIMSWDTDSNGTYTLNVECPQDIKLLVTSKPDNAGTIHFYEWKNDDYTLTFKAVWEADGHGEYWEYENGEEAEHGNW